MAPFIPETAIFNERLMRDSDTENPNKKLLAPLADYSNRMDFNADHFNKFLKQEENNNNNHDGLASVQGRRRRNVLGDFKFKKITEVF